MSQRWFEWILFCFASKVIAAGTEVSGAENHTSCDFPFQVEVILQCVRELRMVSRTEKEYRLAEHRSLRARKTREDQSIYAEKRR